LNKRIVTAGSLLVLISCCLPSYTGASTTGSLRGRVTDSVTDAPIAGAIVRASAPSQVATTTTDATGNFAFLSLGPDTYTVSVTKADYDPGSQPGVSVVADQSASVNVALVKTIKTIATVNARRPASLVHPGITSDVYSVNAAGQRASLSLGGSGSLDQAYGAIASVPGVSIPSGQQGWYQSVFIRGGDYDQVGYEFDGVPVVRQSDGAPIVTLSALGQQEVQVYTGGTPATADAPGLAGYINQVIKAGTYPGYANADFGAGAPAFYHKASVEVGGSTPNRSFSYYIGLAGANEDYRYGNQFNAVSDPLYFFPLSIPTNNSSFYILDGGCGDTTLSTPCGGPLYGAQFSPGTSWLQSNNNDREMVANLHFGLPHHHDSGRDDLQYLLVAGSIFTTYFSNVGDLGLSGPVPFLDASVAAGGGYYTGPLMAAPNPNDFATALFPSSPQNRVPGSLIPASQRDGGSNSYSISKVQFQHNINDRSYLRAIGYGEYTNWFLNGPNSAEQTFGATLSDYEVIGWVYGGSLTYSNALSDKNTLTAAVSYQTQKLQTYNATFDTVLSPDPLLFVNNTGQFGNVASAFATRNGRCYSFQTGAVASCYDLNLLGGPGNLSPAPQYTCPNSTIPACAANPQWLMVENGQNAQVDNVTPYFSSLALTDEMHPSDKWMINAGLRYDHFAYRLNNLETAYPARQFWFDAYNNEHCSAPGVDNVTRSPGGSCPTGFSPSALVNTAGGDVSQNVFQPRVAATYTLNPDTVLRGSAGVFTRPAATSYHQYNTYQQDLASFISQFSSLGYTTPDHNVRADTSDNFDLSLEHHIKGTQISYKISPFYRRTHDQLQYLNISALGGTLAGVNVGTLTATGVELSIQAGNFAADGFSGQLSYTYTDTHTRYSAFSNGLNLIDVLNRQIELYNSYTSACAGANVTRAACGGGLYTSNQNGQASFCVSGCGTPSAVIVPNPYFKSAPQPLMDPNGQYVPYDVIPSPFASANSYAVPHVATLILNYRHKKLSITPTFSYNSGSYYGSPLSVPGYVPQACTQVPSQTVVGGVASPTTPGASCFQSSSAANPNQPLPATIFVPNPYTGRFDGLGSLREPWQFTANLQMSYDVSPRATITLVANNLFNQCYQRGYVWDTSTACWYSSLPSNVLAPNGPGSQPGAYITNPPRQLAYPYGIWFNNTQVGITAAKQPFQLTVNLSLKM
jgi:hypothetical protein